MRYHHYEMHRLALAPMRVMASNMLGLLDLPGNPIRQTHLGRVTAAMLDSFEHSTRRFGKPAFGHHHTIIDGEKVEIVEEAVLVRPWMELKQFRRLADRPNDPPVLIVAPMSGHFSTLLRGTVKEMLPDHDVYITDWSDARDVPLTAGDFDLDDYIDTITDCIRHLGPDVHVIAVCQPAVPVLAAVALMNAAGDPGAPRSMTLIGGPIDTREGPTEVNKFAKRHNLEWFRQHTIHTVPVGTPGFMRRVYPGFLQLAGFMAMNLDRHVQAHWDMFDHLVQGDGENLNAKRRFYEEYRSVMDLSAAYYLQTIEAVFQEHLLPRGLLFSRGQLVEPAAIRRTALMTIEGERDDISGIGQTRAAHALARELPERMRAHHEQEGVGHYGLFNGRRFRDEIAPKIKAFIQTHI